jgi:hypothetical protein
MDGNAAYHALGGWAMNKIRSEGLFGVVRFFFQDFEVIFHPDLCYFQDVIDIFDIALHLCPKAILRGGNPFSGQRRGQCPHHSSGRRCHDMVEGGGVLYFRINLVKFLDAAMDAIINGLLKPFDHGPPCRPLFPDDFDSGCVYNLAHVQTSFLDFSAKSIKDIEINCNGDSVN